MYLGPPEVRAGGKGLLLPAALRRIRLIILDVDGVLTDGTVSLDGRGTEAKVFSVRDGTGVTLLHAAPSLAAARESVAAHAQN
jgi:3-deoxy-D-manno-octulosonate 8-phosphate phosphatase (KDO 8-P phosphatase)